MGSTFNNPPRKVIKPFGIGGNALIAIGASFLLVAIVTVQKSGFLIPHVIGPGLSPVGRLEIDLTPDELKQKE